MRAYKFLAILLGIILGLLFMEIIIRAYYFKKNSTSNLILSTNKNLIYEYKPSFTFTNNYGIKISYSSLGFIGDELKPKTRSIFRIPAIGDSIFDLALTRI